MSHKAVVQFEGIKNATKDDRNMWVATVWKLMQASGMKGVQELHDSNTINGFVWNVEEQEDGKFLFEFSSIREDLVQAVLDGANEAIKKGTAWNLSNDVIIKPTSAFPVEDLRIYDGTLRLAPVSGIIVNKIVRNQYKNGKKKKHYEAINPVTERQAFVKSVKQNLLQKVNKFAGTNIKEDECQIRIIASGCQTSMPFRGLPFVGSMCSIQIKGPKKLLETALYAGLGKMNGLGFGMMTPLKKQAFSA